MAKCSQVGSFFDTSVLQLIAARFSIWKLTSGRPLRYKDIPEHVGDMPARKLNVLPTDQAVATVLVTASLAGVSANGMDARALLTALEGLVLLVVRVASARALVATLDKGLVAGLVAPAIGRHER